LDYRGRDAIYYVPDESAAKKLNIRLENLIASSEYLAARINATSEAKRVGMATLHIEGSRGVSAGRSTPAAIIVLDEYDIFDPANAEEIAKRLTGAKNGLEICASTPSLPGCGIDGLVERFSEQLEVFKAPCPHCFERITLDYETCFHREGEYENDPKCEQSYIKCSSCGEQINADDKRIMLSVGSWQLADATKDRRAETRVLTGLNHLYSATVTEEALARASLKTGEAAVREFHNSNLGKTYVEAKGEITRQVLESSLSTKFSMRSPNYPRSIDPTQPPRFLTIDQGRPHSAVVCEFHSTVRKPWHSTYTDGYRCKVLHVEKVSEKSRLDSIARDWQIWGIVMDIDPDDTLPGYLMFGRDRFANSHGFVVGARALDSWNTFEGLETPGVEADEPLPPLAYITFHRSHYYARAIDRVNSGYLTLPQDCPTQFAEELTASVKTHRLDPTGNQRLYVAKKSGKPNDYLSCLQLSEIALELHLRRKIGLREYARPKDLEIASLASISICCSLKLVIVSLVLF
jgi:hypothetical protein